MTLAQNQLLQWKITRAPKKMWLMKWLQVVKTTSATRMFFTMVFTWRMQTTAPRLVAGTHLGTFFQQKERWHGAHQHHHQVCTIQPWKMPQKSQWQGVFVFLLDPKVEKDPSQQLKSNQPSVTPVKSMPHASPRSTVFFRWLKTKSQLDSEHEHHVAWFFELPKNWC